ncbi:serine/threonine protein kinase [Cystobacter fuscus]|uniref:Serine/threonine protein kinase n=1 Tax=Cystobacter fuscus TaxID=43 RepID=A0A250JI83_9BACT|nr:serine/threonine-protein kinase [Cystobacter fuscus]ATB43604.1 serine/threonine protein kinase [Cystobacter fuscus]
MTQVQLPQLGKYRLLEVIAKGGMGEVYKAQQEGPAGFSKTVVVKRVLPHLADAENFIDMFLEEARLAARLSHPNVVQIFELGEDRGEYFIAMEYIQGPSLHRVRKRLRELGHPFPVDIAAYVVAQALQGLHYAHELRDEAGKPLGIVHRDISPDNILVTMDGVVKVVDFGIAKAADSSSKTQSGTLKGKLSYISPEQVNGWPASVHSDIYATGVVLYQLFTNTLPFRAPSNAALLQQIATAEPEAPDRLELDVPPVLSRIVMKALRKEPGERFATAQEMSRALLEALESCQRRLFPEDLGAFLKQLFEQEGSPRRFFAQPTPRGTGRSSPPMVVEDEATAPLAGPVLSNPPTVTMESARPRNRAIAWAVGGALLSVAVGVVALRPWERGTPPAPAPVAPSSEAPAPAPENVQAQKPVTPEPSPEKAAVPPPREAAPPPDEPTPEPTTPSPAPSPQEPSRVAAMGRVQVRVNPWAEVFYEGHRLGITPMPAIRLPAGRRTLTLKNKELGVSRDYRVSVPANGEVTLKADLLE